MPGTVVIADYGMGNLFSIERAIRHVGGQAKITSDADEIASAERLILPGVGAFGEAMDELKGSGLKDAVGRFVKSGRPLMGICLGMQLLMSESYEFGHHEGLGYIKGKVVKFREPEQGQGRFKVPQIGWNAIEPRAGKGADSWKGTILEGLRPGAQFYFVHSFFCIPEDGETSLAETVYGRDRYCSVIRNSNVWGCQFHPEKSAEDGLRIYKNFLKI